MPFEILPTKASGPWRRRRLVYLDQNVLSALARYRISPQRKSLQTNAYAELDCALRVSVLERGDARCVESMFHYEESRGLLMGRDPDASERLFDALCSCLKIYSWGLRFNGQSEIACSQALAMVVATSALEPYPSEFLLRLAFTSDPNISNNEEGIEVAGDLFLPVVSWQPNVIKKDAGWAMRLEALRAQGHFSTYELAYLELCQGTRETDGAVCAAADWASLWGASGQGPSSEKVEAFVRSSSYCELPINVVGISILARVLSDRPRPLRDSDKTDAQILSLAIPYCDLVVTDAHMTSVVKGLELDRRYITKVLPATNKGIGAAAEWLRNGVGYEQT